MRFVAAARSNDIHIWDSERLKAPQIILTNALLTQLGTVHQLSAIAIDPTGQWIVTGSTSGQICWWDARRARLIRVFREHACLLPNYREDINQAISSVSVSADARVAVSARLGEVQVWDTRTGELLRSLPAPSQQVAISADAKICLVGGWSERAAIWDRTAPVLDDPLDHRAEVTAVALSDDGTVALTGSDGATLTGHTVRVWNTSTGRLRYALDCRDAPRALALSPDGTRALVAGEYERPTQHSLEWWDLHGCSRISRVEGIDRTSGVALHPSLHRAMVTGNRHASLRSLPEGKHLKVVAAPISSLSPDGRFVAHCAPLTLFGPTRDCDALRLVDLDEQSVDEKTIVVDQTPSFNCICLGVDGKFALIGRSDGVLETWDLERERRVRTLMAHTSPVRGVALSGNQRLGASTDGRSIRFWDLSAGRCLAAYPTSESISSFRWSREGLFLLAAGRVARWGRLHFRGDSGSWGASSEDQLPDAPDTVEAIGGSALGTGAES